MLIYSYLVSVRAERLKERLSVRACLHVDLSIAILICDHDEDSNTYYLLLFAASSLLHTDINFFITLIIMARGHAWLLSCTCMRINIGLLRLVGYACRGNSYNSYSSFADNLHKLLLPSVDKTTAVQRQ